LDPAKIQRLAALDVQLLPGLAAVGGLTGVVVWALVSFVPAFHNGVPEPIVDALPFILAWAGHTVAAYRAPHTSRPDLNVTPAGPVMQK